MSEDIYAIALKTTLSEVRNICPGVTRSFIFTKDGTIIAEAAQDAEVSTERTFHSLQSLMEKADIIGGLNTFLVNGNKGAIHISQLDSMYLALSASKKADMTYIQSVANTIVPTVLKLVETIVSTPLKSSPSSQDFMAENLTGFFAGETAQIDNGILKDWSENFKNVHINEIEIETANGKIARCRVKAISEREFKGKGLIRIPEKIYRTLEVEKGEQVKVRPITSEGR